jgi:hypothetical protein
MRKHLEPEAGFGIHRQPWATMGIDDFEVS